jgi:hypothetical protein
VESENTKKNRRIHPGDRVAITDEEARPFVYSCHPSLDDRAHCSDGVLNFFDLKGVALKDTVFLDPPENPIKNRCCTRAPVLRYSESDPRRNALHCGVELSERNELVHSVQGLLRSMNAALEILNPESFPHTLTQKKQDPA